MNDLVEFWFASTLFVAYVSLVALTITGYWKAFTKAGQPGWAILIPFYNIYILLKIANRPGWWLLLYLIPFVSIFISCIIMLEIARRFGKGVWFGLGLWLLAFIFFPILGFGSAQYIPPGSRMQKRRRHARTNSVGLKFSVSEENAVRSPSHVTRGTGCRNPGGTGIASKIGLRKNQEDSLLDGNLNPLHFLIPLLVVAQLFVTIFMVAQEGNWCHEFFLNRGFVQWVTLYCFVLALVLLSRRIPILLREKRALSNLKNGNRDISQTCAVNARFRRIRKHIKQGRAENVRMYAQNLSETDSEELESGYSLTGVIVNILPLIGFFGTVLGLSTGLYERYIGKTAERSTDSFVQAIGTAFDTTLLALGCTIVIIIIQRLIHKQEDSCLLRLSRFVDRYIYKKTKQISRNKGESEGCLATEAMERITKSVENMSTRFAERLDKDLTESIAQAAGRSKTLFSGIANQVAGIFQNELSTATNQALGNVANQHEIFTREMLNNVSPRFAETLKNAVQSIEKRNGSETRAVANAIHTSLSSLGTLIQNMVQGTEGSLAYRNLGSLRKDTASAVAGGEETLD